MKRKESYEFEIIYQTIYQIIYQTTYQTTYQITYQTTYMRAKEHRKLYGIHKGRIPNLKPNINRQVKCWF